MISVLAVLTPYQLSMQKEKENNKERWWEDGKSSMNMPLALYGYSLYSYRYRCIDIATDSWALSPLWCGWGPAHDHLSKPVFGRDRIWCLMS